MCGIAGIWDAGHRLDAGDLRRVADGMASRLVHRGPDRAGSWLDGAHGIAFGFRRLAIVDTTRAGDQPMTSQDGRWTIVFNGEIYNHAGLRGRLESRGHRFRGHSDTEALVETIAADGVDGALAACEGMYAFAAWDAARQQLHLARDPVGEKPLLCGRVRGSFAFASELGAFEALDGFAYDLDDAALAMYLRLGYVPAPRTIDRRITKLEPGSHVVVDPNGGIDVTRHWSIAEIVRTSVARRAPVTLDEAVDTLRARIHAAVGARCIADVPVGAFLSSGVDSRAVVAAMAATRSQATTFTVSFPELANHDEASTARQVASALATDHHELVVTASEAIGAVPDAIAAYDEPFADPAAISSFVISRAARSVVTVALSGDGGDELFGGYPRYHRMARSAGRLARIPAPVRRGVAASLGRAARTPPAARWRERLLKAAALTRGSDRSLGAPGAIWPDPRSVAPAAPPVTTLWDTPERWPCLGSTVERMMFVDQALSLPEQMLTKVDRASMRSSLEVRSPLVAPALVELAWSLPPELVVGESAPGKALLRELVARDVAVGLEPKRGFDPPIGAWMRGPLRSWCAELLDPREIDRAGVLSARTVDAAWKRVLDGRDEEVLRVWSIVALRAWARSHDAAL